MGKVLRDVGLGLDVSRERHGLAVVLYVGGGGLRHTPTDPLRREDVRGLRRLGQGIGPLPEACATWWMGLDPAAQADVLTLLRSIPAVAWDALEAVVGAEGEGAPARV